MTAPIGLIAGSGRFPVLFAQDARCGNGMLAIVFLLVLGTVGCRRSENPEDKGKQVGSTSVTPDQVPQSLQAAQQKLNSLADQTRLEMKQDELDRQTLVTPAATNYKPEVQGRKLRLSIVPQKTMLRKGEAFWYTVEIRNSGTEPVVIMDPFIKSGLVDDPRSKFHITVTPRHWHGAPSLADATPCYGAGLPIPGWGEMNAQRRLAATKQWMAESALRHAVDITLNPGETLRTQDWRAVSSEEFCTSYSRGQTVSDRPGDQFREYPERRDFDRPGTYFVKVGVDDPATPMAPSERLRLKQQGFSDAAIRLSEQQQAKLHLGTAESDPIRIEVLPP